MLKDIRLTQSQGLIISLSACIVGIGFFMKSLWSISQGYSYTLMVGTDIQIPYGVLIQLGLSVFVISCGLSLYFETHNKKMISK